jgi:hypothetical protein
MLLAKRQALVLEDMTKGNLTQLISLLVIPEPVLRATAWNQGQNIYL